MDKCGSKFVLGQVQKMHPSNNNINNTNITTTNRKKSAAAIAVNFKKLKKKRRNEKTLETWTYLTPYEKLEKVTELLS